MKTEEITLQEAALAWAQGKRVEARPVFPGGSPWSQIAPLGTVKNQMWPASIFNDIEDSRAFRLAPEPPAKKFRKWTREEVPVGAIIKAKGKLWKSLIVGVTGDGLIQIHGGGFATEFALENHLHSIDNGKTWLPCGVEVSE